MGQVAIPSCRNVVEKATDFCVPVTGCYIGPHFKSHWLQNLEMSCGLDGCGRASEGFSDLRFLAGHLGWSKRDLLPAHALANQLWAIVRLELDNAIIDDRAGIPNQVQHNGSVLVEFGVELPEFRVAAGWFELGSERLRKAVENGNVLPDGGDLEQSFNYNKNLIDAGASMPKLFDGVGICWSLPGPESTANGSLLIIGSSRPAG